MQPYMAHMTVVYSCKAAYTHIQNVIAYGQNPGACVVLNQHEWSYSIDIPLHSNSAIQICLGPTSITAECLSTMGSIRMLQPAAAPPPAPCAHNNTDWVFKQSIHCVLLHSPLVAD
jgi:hypothetical protein